MFNLTKLLKTFNLYYIFCSIVKETNKFKIIVLKKG